MNKQEIYRLLDEQHIACEVTEHDAVYNMAEAATIKLPHPEDEAKNLFLRDKKKEHYYLVTVKANKRVDLKAFRQQHGLQALSFATPDDLMNLLGLIPGAVTPLGLLNDPQHRVIFYLDEAFQKRSISVHPNDNTATIWLKTEDLLRLIEANGNEIHFSEF